MLEDIISGDENRPNPTINGNSGLPRRLPFGGLGLLGNFMSLEEIIQQISEHDVK